MKLADATQLTTWLPAAIFSLGSVYAGARCLMLGSHDGAAVALLGAALGTMLFGRTLSTVKKVRAALTEVMQIFSLKAQELSETATSFGSAASEQASAVSQIGSTTAELNQTGQAAAEIARRMVKSAEEAAATGEK